MDQNHSKSSVSSDNSIALDMSAPQSTEGGIELNSNPATRHPFITDKNKNNNTLSQRVVHLEMQNTELNSMLVLERRAFKLQQQASELQRQAYESRLSLLRGMNNTTWNSFATLFDRQRRRNLHRKNILKRDLQDMANIVRHCAGRPSLISGDSTGAICKDDDEYDSDDFEILNNIDSVRYNTRSVESSWRMGTTGGEASPKNQSNLAQIFESLPKIPSTLPSISSRPDIAHLTKDVALSGVPVISQQSDFQARSKRTAAQMESPTNSNNPRFPLCIQCYVHNRRCDPGVICDSCSQNGKACKRARCKHYPGSLCQVKNCTKAHEEDEATYGHHIVEAGHVQKLRDEGAEWNQGYAGDGGDGGVELDPRPKRKRPKVDRRKRMRRS